MADNYVTIITRDGKRKQIKVDLSRAQVITSGGAINKTVRRKDSRGRTVIVPKSQSQINAEIAAKQLQEQNKRKAAELAERLEKARIDEKLRKEAVQAVKRNNYVAANRAIQEANRQLRERQATQLIKQLKESSAKQPVSTEVDILSPTAKKLRDDLIRTKGKPVQPTIEQIKAGSGIKPVGFEVPVTNRVPKDATDALVFKYEESGRKAQEARNKITGAIDKFLEPKGDRKGEVVPEFVSDVVSTVAKSPINVLGALDNLALQKQFESELLKKGLIDKATLKKRRQEFTQDVRLPAVKKAFEFLDVTKFGDQKVSKGAKIQQAADLALVFGLPIPKALGAAKAKAANVKAAKIDAAAEFVVESVKGKSISVTNQGVTQFFVEERARITVINPIEQVSQTFKVAVSGKGKVSKSGIILDTGKNVKIKVLDAANKVVSEQKGNLAGFQRTISEGATKGQLEIDFVKAITGKERTITRTQFDVASAARNKQATDFISAAAQNNIYSKTAGTSYKIGLEKAKDALRDFEINDFLKIDKKSEIVVSSFETSVKQKNPLLAAELSKPFTASFASFEPISPFILERINRNKINVEGGLVVGSLERIRKSLVEEVRTKKPTSRTPKAALSLDNVNKTAFDTSQEFKSLKEGINKQQNIGINKINLVNETNTRIKQDLKKDVSLAQETAIKSDTLQVAKPTQKNKLLTNVNNVLPKSPNARIDIRRFRPPIKLPLPSTDQKDKKTGKKKKNLLERIGLQVNAKPSLLNLETTALQTGEVPKLQKQTAALKKAFVKGGFTGENILTVQQKQGKVKKGALKL